ncbi:MAG: beta-N-acetylhexosaminidase [Candidatus Poribacteria bacterium]|nr:beta-N-acetylhexosaminidase [Candidatus Poribacteria bacterium]
MYFINKALLSFFLIILTASNSFALTDAEIEGLLGRMSLEEKIGQLFIVGTGGRQVGRVPKAHISKRFVGGFILYEKNVSTPDQVAALTTELQLHAQKTPNGIPLFIAIDQEGGKVSRFKRGTTIFPGNMALGATQSQPLALRAGKITGIELKVMGINLNLAPVLDVNTNPKNPAIGIRSYGESPELVSQLGTAYIRGIQSQDVLATAKHFPGHGDANADSYKKLPLVTKSHKGLDKVELVPFCNAIDAGVAAIMTAHILYPGLDNQMPATLSHTILTKLLREELGFEGLIITDDLEMKAIEERYDISKAAVLTIQAGADMLLIPWTLQKQQNAFNAVRQAIKTKRITKTRLNDSLRRILKAKNAIGMFEQRIAHIENPQAINSPLSVVGNREHRDIAQKISTQAVSIVKDTPGILPLDAEPKKPVLIISPSRDFSNTFMKAHLDLTHVTTILIPPIIITRQYIPHLLSSKPTVIVAGIANLKQAQLVHQLSKTTDVPIIAISVTSPYLLSECPNVECAIAAYDNNYFSLLAAVEVLLGKKQAKGKLPVTIPFQLKN